jgi:neutral ceramidase
VDSPLLPFVDADRGIVSFTDVPAPPVALDPVDGLLAGAAEVDITPPPGMPKAGYSKNAHDGTGFRTRLRARVIHLRSGSASVALVTLDLLGGSAVLQRLVARAVADRTDVPLHGLFVGATHTHAGPGQFQGSPFYSRFASNRPGFDPAWAQFLVDRISGAVLEAVASRRPARAAMGRIEVWGLTRNRSLDPHLRNGTVPDEPEGAHRKFGAVNPWLHVLRVDAAAAGGAYEPLAALATFSIHGTGISHHAHEYNADVWAYLVEAMGRGIERTTGVRPVIGAMEATHADVAPALRPGLAGYREAERIGGGIGDAGSELHASLEAALTDDVPLSSGLREIDLGLGYDAGGIDGITLAPPALGASQVAGAKENLTPVLGWLPPFRAGMPKPAGLSRRSAHGPKWVLASRWLQPRILPTADFPSVLPIQAVRVGSTVIVGAPFEITVESGRRVREAVLSATAGHGVDDAVVSSVANEYWGYCTTPEEYELQYYEGGHTLHGPTTQPWLAAQAARLAASVGRGEVVADVVARSFRLPSRRYLARPGAGGSGAVARRADGVATFVDPTAIDEGYWEQRWRDVGAGDLRWHEPLARVERIDGRAVADDQSGAVAVLQVSPGVYAARWYAPTLGRGPQHRFVLPANHGRPELRTDPFG